MSQGAVFKADSIQELAEKIAVDPANLTATVNRYNEPVVEGKDLNLYKDDHFMTLPVKEGPFYAVRANSTTLGTVGGALVNEHFEALNVKRQVIDGIYGIYAVGNDASGLYDSSYPTIEGLSNAFAWNSGRIAGRYASAYATKN
ncbi:FAD-binding protein [Lactobacillus delbrueckii]|uniref:FAD-binding protein n=1 Tax=Lactobacillus delbrueckii TaxID=1584 RepID=UPI0022A96F5D|nr:FAD-binding protein [Lactobacillus delbrueckii]